MLYPIWRRLRSTYAPCPLAFNRALIEDSLAPQSRSQKMIGNSPNCRRPATNEATCGLRAYRDRVNGLLGLSDYGDRDLEPRNAHRKFGALTSWGIGGKPPQPLLVHARKVVLIREDDGSTDDLV